jgi:hypothetical protein
MVVQLKEGAFPRMEDRRGMSCVAPFPKKEVSMKQYVIMFLATVFVCGILTGCHRGRPDDQTPVGPIGGQAGINSVAPGASTGR